jgi:UDP-N-acetylmuramate dehydrogenase
MSLEIKENEILADHTTFKIGGLARYFCVAKNKEELIEAIEFAKSLPFDKGSLPAAGRVGGGLPFFIIGGGSNILFRDEVYEGLIIKFQDSKFVIHDSGMTVGAGALFSQLIMKSIESGLTGLEWGMGIPGTVGGAVAGNCGAYGHSIHEFVKSVTVLDSEGEEKRYAKEECVFGYRESKFKTKIKTTPATPSLRGGQEIILEVEFDLEKGSKEESMKKIKEIVLGRKNKNLLPSAGCFFKNIILDSLANKEKFLELIPQEKIKGGKFPTAWLIEKCEFKGKQIGGAKISEEHCNYIINEDGAKASDVLELARVCKEEVLKKFGIALEEETVVV